MALGDNTFFEEALDDAFFEGWAAADDIKVALITNGTVPTAGDTTPALGDYTEVTAGGNYTAGGTSIGAWGTLASEAAGVLTWDSATNPSWAQDGSNPTNAYYAVLYNDTQAGDPAFAFVDIDGPFDMSAGTLTLTWNANGIFRITVSNP